MGGGRPGEPASDVRDGVGPGCGDSGVGELGESGAYVLDERELKPGLAVIAEDWFREGACVVL